MRKIAVITGTRADYGLLYWIIQYIHDDPGLELQLIVTGMHLSPEFGLTIEVIEKNGFPITEKVEMLLSSDTEEAIATSMGLGMIGFAKVYSRINTDIILVLGDRFEIHAAVSAAVPFRIPVAHIHGGESTEGVIDESIRHAITKMSHIHFAAADKYRTRIIQLGEHPKNVFNYGAPGLDNIYKLNLWDRISLVTNLGLIEEKQIGVVTYHPVTLEKSKAQTQILELLKAISYFSDIFWVITLPNADTEGRVIINIIRDFIKRNSRMGKIFISLGQLRYLTLLKHSLVMVGNSSSGLTEAPSFGLSVVNIGDRQLGRIKSENIIDVCQCKEKYIVDGIKKAISPEFRTLCIGVKSAYGEGGASKKIVEKLKTILLSEALIKKKFYEVS